MATRVAFSAMDDDYVVVEESLREAQEKLGLENRSSAGLCQLMQVPHPALNSSPILINPERVAYLEATPDH